MKASELITKADITMFGRRYRNVDVATNVPVLTAGVESMFFALTIHFDGSVAHAEWEVPMADYPSNLVLDETSGATFSPSMERFKEVIAAGMPDP